MLSGFRHSSAVLNRERRSYKRRTWNQRKQDWEKGVVKQTLNRLLMAKRPKQLEHLQPLISFWKPQKKPLANAGPAKISKVRKNVLRAHSTSVQFKVQVPSSKARSDESLPCICCDLQSNHPRIPGFTSRYQNGYCRRFLVNLLSIIIPDQPARHLHSDAVLVKSCILLDPLMLDETIPSAPT